jgi:hypothetical protein
VRLVQEILQIASCRFRVLVDRHGNALDVNEVKEAGNNLAQN